MSALATAAVAFDPGRDIDHPSGYLALSPRNARFTRPGRPGMIAYRDHGRHSVLMGGVHAPPDERAGLLDAFCDRAARRRRRIVAVQVREDQVRLFRRRGFVVNPLGSTYALSVDGFSLGGSARIKLRQKVRRALRLGACVRELGRELPRDANSYEKLTRIGNEWLAAKGGKELDFMIGELGRPEDLERRVFVAIDTDGRWCGFISYVPVWGRRPGYLHDLTRRRNDAPTGVMELCNAVALDRFADEGVPYLHLGFTPFALTGARRGDSRLVDWVVGLLWRRGRRVYPAVDQVRYKLKWAPETIETEHVAFRPLSSRAVFDLMRLTRSI